MPLASQRLLEWCRLLAVYASRGMSSPALNRVNQGRDVNAAGRIYRKVRRHDKSVFQLRAGKLAALHRIIDGDVIRLAVQNNRLIGQVTQPLEKEFHASLHVPSLGDGSRAGRYDLELLAVVDLDGLVALALVAVPVITTFFPDLETDDPRVAALTSATGGLEKKDFEEVIRYAQFRKARRAMENAKRPKKKA